MKTKCYKLIDSILIQNANVLELRNSCRTYYVYLVEDGKERRLLSSDKALICKAYIDGYIDGQEGKGLSEHAYITDDNGSKHFTTPSRKKGCVNYHIE